MLSKSRRAVNSERGSSLIFVLMLLVLLAVVGVAMATVLMASQRVDANQQENRQAYFAARSAARAMAAYIEKNPGWISNIPSSGNSVSGTVSGVNPGTDPKNSASVDVSYPNFSAGDFGTIKIVGSGKFEGQTAQAVVTLTPQTNGTSFSDLFSNFIYLSGNNSTYQFNQSNYYGQSGSANPTIAINGSASINNGTSINGTLLAFGDVSMSGSSTNANGVYSEGSITLTNGASIFGSVIANRNLSMENSGATISFLPGSPTQPTINIGGAATISGGCKINGTLIVNSKNNYSISGGASVSKVQFAAPNAFAFNPLSLPSFTAPTDVDFSVVYNSQYFLSHFTNKISTSGTLQSIDGDANTWDSVHGNTYVGHEITISAGDPSKDIYLKLNGSPSFHDVTIDIDAANTRNVYLFLTGGSSTTFNLGSSGNVSFGENASDFKSGKTSATSPKLFVIGDGTEILDTSWSSTNLHAYVYMPQGTCNFEGSSFEPAPPGYSNPFKFVGSIVSKNYNVQSNINFLYTPIPSGIVLPSDIASSGSSSSTTYTEKWSAK